MNRIVLFLFLILLLLLIGYSLEEEKVKVDLKVNRFEKVLFEINNDNVDALASRLEADFGIFNEVFATQIMKKGTLTETEYYNELLAFTQHNDMREAYDSVASLFADFSEIEEELEFAFGQFSVDFPSYPLPEITTFFGGFNYGVVTYDNHIAIGLENFLGKDSKYYSLLGDPGYLRFQKQRKFIASNVLEVWINEHFQQYVGGRDLLSHLIYKGKVMYCIDKTLSGSKLEDKFRFSKDEMDWVEENEASIWKYIVHEDLLFSNDEQKFRTFISYAPFAKGMPSEAPGRVAYYIGYRLVSEYMYNNETSIEDLMYLTDSRDFLKQSRYKPIK